MGTKFSRMKLLLGVISISSASHHWDDATDEPSTEPPRPESWDCAYGDYNVWEGWSLPTHMGVPDVWRLEDVSSSAECAHHCTEKPECQAWSYLSDYASLEYRYVQCNLLSEVYAFEPFAFGAKDMDDTFGFKCAHEPTNIGKLAGTDPHTHYWNTCWADRGDSCDAESADNWAPKQCNESGCWCVDKYGAKVPDSWWDLGDEEITCDADVKIYQNEYSPWHDSTHGIRPEIEEFQTSLEGQEDGNRKKWKAKVTKLIDDGRSAIFYSWDRKKDFCGRDFHLDGESEIEHRGKQKIVRGENMTGRSSGPICKNPKFKTTTENCQEFKTMVDKMGEWANTYNSECTYVTNRGKQKLHRDTSQRHNKKFLCKAMKIYGKANCKK